MLALIVALVAVNLRPVIAAHEMTDRPMSPAIIKVWEDAGARFGRLRKNHYGPIIEDEPADKGELPYFEISGNIKLEDLPIPDVPFGLTYSHVLDADLKQLNRF